MSYKNKQVINALPAKISAMFEKLNDKRSSQLNDIKVVREHIYTAISRNGSFNKLELPDVYEQAQTLKAHILGSLPSHPECMFDVSGRNPQVEESAAKQKAMLADTLLNMQINTKIENIVDDLVETGESIVFIGWQKLFKKRRSVNNIDKIILEENRLIYDGPVLKTIAPEDFVFDTTDKDNWEKCSKIFRTYSSIEALKSDKNNTLLDNTTIEELKNLSLKAVDAYKERGISRSKIEILEYWGDIELENGDVLENQLIVIAGRRFVIRFEDNPYLNCPYIYANIIENPFTGRGISPLKAAISLNTASSSILNNQLEAYSLIVNPPYLAPKGAFKGEQCVKPGKIIEYDSSLLPQSPTPLNFSQALCGWDFIKYFKSSIESATGIFKTMTGDMDGTGRTATELNMSANGQSARLNMILDAVNRKIVVPVVQKTADTIANFKFGPEKLTTMLKGSLVTLDINDDIRLGDYIYKYSDRKATLERRNRQKELAGIITAFGNIPVVNEKINWMQCFKLALEEFGVENLEIYIKEES